MKTVLVADDNLASRELLRAVLSWPGRRILEACDGAEALDIIVKEEPDLVLLDIEMPVKDGFAVLRNLRSDPRLRATRVVAVSANAMQGAREAALRAGFDDYITKPIDGAALRRDVAEVL
jgi:CheY-like chemotaxis protein